MAETRRAALATVKNLRLETAQNIDLRTLDMRRELLPGKPANPSLTVKETFLARLLGVKLMREA
jgi:hypothetical protein